MIGAAIRILVALWPFIREMFFAGKSVKQVILENKMLVFLISMLVFSVTLNFVSFGKLIDIAVARRDDQSQSSERTKTTEKPVVTGPPPEKAASTPAAGASEASDDAEAIRQYEETRKQLEKLYGNKK